MQLASPFPHVPNDDEFATFVVRRMNVVLDLGGKLPPDRFYQHDGSFKCWWVTDYRGIRRVALEQDFRDMDGWVHDALSSLLGQEGAYNA